MPKTLYPDTLQIPGDAGVKIAAAIAMLPAGVGGYVDARGFDNPQTLTGFTIPPGVTVELPPIYCTLPAASHSIWVQDGARLLGSGRGNPGGTTFHAAAGFDKDLIRCMSRKGPQDYWHHGEVRNIRVDGNKTQNTRGHGVAIYNIGETSQVSSLNIQGCAQAGLYIEGSSSGTNSIDHVTVNANGLYGVQLHLFRSGLSLWCVGGDNNPVTFAITSPSLGGGSLLFMDPKSEGCTGPCFLIQGGSARVVLTIEGGEPFVTAGGAVYRDTDCRRCPVRPAHQHYWHGTWQLVHHAH